MGLENGRVRHRGLPEWGIGQVLGDSLDKNARVFFVRAGEKLISFDHVAVIPVTGPKAAHPLLDNLRHPDSVATTRYRSLPESVAYILESIPVDSTARSS